MFYFDRRLCLLARFAINGNASSSGWLTSIPVGSNPEGATPANIWLR
jgi:hypothetical protein